MTSTAEQQLRIKYVANLPSKVEAIGGLLSAHETSMLQVSLHKLAGSAGMYGFSSVSIVAAELEELIVSGESLKSKMFEAKIQQLYVTVERACK